MLPGRKLVRGGTSSPRKCQSPRKSPSPRVQRPETVAPSASEPWHISPESSGMTAQPRRIHLEREHGTGYIDPTPRALMATVARQKRDGQRDQRCETNYVRRQEALDWEQ